METVGPPPGPDGGDVKGEDNLNGDAAPDVPASADAPSGGSGGVTPGSGGAGGGVADASGTAGAGGAGTGSGGAASPHDATPEAADGGIADVPAEKPAQIETRVDATSCASGFHVCGSGCAANSSPDHCGPISCSPCPVPVGGAATCDGMSCGISCNADRTNCGTVCAAADDPAACGPACTRCAVDPNGNSQCIGGTCRLQCRPGFHPCDNRCADDMSPASCGSLCEPCLAPIGGRALCVQLRCEQICLDGMRLCHGICIDATVPCDGSCPVASHLCGDACRPNTSVNTCGTLCAPCAAPPSADPICDGDSCSYKCSIGFHACGSSCPANDRSVACLTTKIAGNPMGYVDSSGNETIAALSVDAHVIQVVRGPNGVVATDLTRESGALVNPASDPWGYLRSDGAAVVVYRATDDRIHEIGRNPNWADSELTSTFEVPSPAHPTATVRAYVRSDGRNAVVYRGADNHLWELASNFGYAPAWLASDLTSFIGAPDVSGNPMGYFGADNQNALVYRAVDGHLHEISSHFGSAPAWVDADLTTATGQTVLPASDPWGYRRGDGQNAVVYLGTDGEIHELRKATTGMWTHQLLPASSPAGNPSAFVRSDGKSTVVYRSTAPAGGSIHVLVLDGSWTDASIEVVAAAASGPASNPIGVHTSTVDDVIYRDASGQLASQRRDPPSAWLLTTY